MASTWRGPLPLCFHHPGGWCECHWRGSDLICCLYNSDSFARWWRYSAHPWRYTGSTGEEVQTVQSEEEGFKEGIRSRRYAAAVWWELSGHLPQRLCPDVRKWSAARFVRVWDLWATATSNDGTGFACFRFNQTFLSTAGDAERERYNPRVLPERVCSSSSRSPWTAAVHIVGGTGGTRRLVCHVLEAHLCRRDFRAWAATSRSDCGHLEGLDTMLGVVL